MNRKTLIILFAAFVALTAGIFAQSSLTLIKDAGNSQLPEIILPDLQGKQRNITEWQGKVIIINFWATWCPPCLKEIPEFIELQKELGDLGLQFIGIAIEEQQPVDEYVSLININYPILIGEDSGIALSVALGNLINAVPFSVVVDRKGNIAHRQPGEFSKQQILEIVNPLL